ncbi:MAG: TauD/TfdA family dioxygenase [Pseudomonadota bacterium]|nr:TauD/TfdA family dioxygenase [Pseudomonadota bacterium]
MANISIVPLGATIGARVEGIDFSEPLTEALRDAIRAAIGEHKVLVFKGEPLPAAVFRAFARKFGPLQEHVLRKYRHDEFPDLSWLTNVAEDGSFDPFGVVRASTWHSDGSYTQDPPELGMLHAFEVPSRGGSTIFADMCNAYDTLDADMQSRMSGLTGLHRHGAGPGGSMYENVLDDDQEEKTNDAVHPTVSVHPSTGRKMLYLNETHTRKFRELELTDSVALLQKVITHATRPENIYTHHWSVGDLLIWDQRSTIHRGAGDFPPDERQVKIRAIVEEFD